MSDWSLGGNSFTREDMCALLRGEKGNGKISDEKIRAFAALMLEKDAMVMSDMRNTIDGLKVKNNDLQNKLASVDVILREKALRGGKWRR